MTDHTPSGITPTLIDVLLTATDRALASVHTALPGKVVAYDSSTQTVDVQLQVPSVYRTEDGVRTVEEYPTIPNVPVAFPRGNGFSITMPLAADDFVLVLATEQSTDRWRETGQVQDPGDVRRFDFASSIAIPGVFPDADALSEAPTDAIHIGKDGGTATIKVKESTIELAGAGDAVALASLVKSRLDAIQSAFDSHTHGYIDTQGAAETETPSVTGGPNPPIGSIASFASTKVKAE